jgi:hypothetical protein
MAQAKTINTTNLTRRAALTLSGSVLLSTVCVAASPFPDAALVALAAEIDELNALLVRAYDSEEIIIQKVHAEIGDNPCKPRDWLINHASDAELAANERACEQWRKRKRAAENRYCLPEAAAVCEDLAERVATALLLAVETPARTFEGIHLKARLARDQFSDKLTWSVVDDLNAMEAA